MMKVVMTKSDRSIPKLVKAVQDLTKKVDSGFEQVDKRFEQVDQRFDELEIRIGNSFGDVQEQINKLATKDDLARVASDVREEFETLKRRVLAN